MITIVAGNEAQRRTVSISADMKQGQWAYRNGADSDGNEQVTPVASSGNASLSRGKLVMVYKETLHKDKDDSYYETIYTNDGDDYDDGYPAAMVIGGGVTIEDDQLDSRVDADFSSASHGDLMVLTASGYPTLDGASDDPGADVTPVAVFENILGSVVTYTTI